MSNALETKEPITDRVKRMDLSRGYLPVLVVCGLLASTSTGAVVWTKTVSRVEVVEVALTEIKKENLALRVGLLEQTVQQMGETLREIRSLNREVLDNLRAMRAGK